MGALTSKQRRARHEAEETSNLEWDVFDLRDTAISVLQSKAFRDQLFNDEGPKRMAGTRVIVDMPLRLIQTGRHVNQAKVRGYIADMFLGAIFPPVKLYKRRFDRAEELWIISDGGHRVAAARWLGRETIRAKCWLTTDEMEVIFL